MDQRPLIIYHANCADGMTAAWIAHNHFKGNVELLPLNYNQDAPLPKVENRVVFMLDFALPRHATKNIGREASKLIVLDHHETAREIVGDLNGWSGMEVVFDMERSGAAITWDYFYRDLPRPWLVNYVQDHDLWRHELPWSAAVSAYIGSTPKTIAAWDELVRNTVAQCAQRGEAILRYQRNVIDEAKAQARRIQLDDATFMLTCSTVLFSDIAGELARENRGCDFGAAYFLRADNKVQFSLRSHGAFNVAEFAATHGGGGHKNAAGFQMELDEFLELLSNQ